MKNNEETDYNEAMVKLTLENNALLKTILHYIEKMKLTDFKWILKPLKRAPMKSSMATCNKLLKC